MRAGFSSFLCVCVCVSMGRGHFATMTFTSLTVSASRTLASVCIAALHRVYGDGLTEATCVARVSRGVLRDWHCVHGEAWS